MIIAMWSGPRNLSTALMRAFAQRRDTQAWDEPFYAAYLRATGIDHPMAEAIIAAGVTDPQAVARACVKPPAAPRTVSYQKHMTQHMIDGFPLDWSDRAVNAFLIRSPERVLASYARKREAVTAEDIGFRMQHVLFERAAERSGRTPAVIDSTDIRRAPEAALRALTTALGLAFDPAMLSWKAGPAPEDGIWGRHWYDAIWRTTGFGPPEEEPPGLPPPLQRIADEVRPHYDAVARYKLAVRLAA